MIGDDAYFFLSSSNSILTVSLLIVAKDLLQGTIVGMDLLQSRGNAWGYHLESWQRYPT